MRAVLASLLVLWALPAAAQAVKGHVVSVADGDTVTVITEDKRRIRIRLQGLMRPSGLRPTAE